jgi:hypothetical protein
MPDAPKRNIANAVMLIGVTLVFLASLHGSPLPPPKNAEIGYSEVCLGFGYMFLICGFFGKLVEWIAKSVGLK